MNNYSNWPYANSQRRWEEVNNALQRQHEKNMRDSTRFIPPPAQKEPLLAIQDTAKAEDVFSTTKVRSPTRRRVKPSLWKRLKTWLS